jgi:hypothetical protein
VGIYAISFAGGPVYVFIDESGNFDFTSSGTRLFIMTAVVVSDPTQGSNELLKWRHHILTCDAKTLKTRNTRDCTHFHCTEDSQYARDGVFSIVAAMNFEAYAVIIEKRKVNPSIRPAHALYEKAFRGLVLGFLRRNAKVSEAHIFAAELKTQKKKSAFLGALKGTLAGEKGLRYQIHLHPTQSHHMLQVSDYVCWAIARKHELKDDRSYRLIKANVKSEFDLFRRGTTIFY